VATTVAAASQTPAGQQVIQTVEQNLPALESVVPAVESLAPSLESAAPAIENAAPVVENALPAVENAAPTVENAAANAGGGGAPTLADITSRLQQHLQTAINRFNATPGGAFTPKQALRLLSRPGLRAAFQGERIDTFFKAALQADTELMEFLQITPRFVRGPDVFYPGANVWWDVTTLAQWGAHVAKYTAGWGAGIPGLFW